MLAGRDPPARANRGARTSKIFGHDESHPRRLSNHLASLGLALAALLPARSLSCFGRLAPERLAAFIVITASRSRREDPCR